MIDRKSLAAGDTVQMPARIVRVIASTEPAQHKCERCGTVRGYFEKCTGCAALAPIPCDDCGEPFGAHKVSYGSRTKRRKWQCSKMWPKFCSPKNDPIKQRAIEQDDLSKPRFIYVDEN